MKIYNQLDTYPNKIFTSLKLATNVVKNALLATLLTTVANAETNNKHEDCIIKPSNYYSW